jgi:hypothetical protein
MSLYKIVGAGADGLFPPRVMAALDARYEGGGGGEPGLGLLNPTEETLQMYGASTGVLVHSSDVPLEPGDTPTDSLFQTGSYSAAGVTIGQASSGVLTAYTVLQKNQLVFQNFDMAYQVYMLHNRLEYRDTNYKSSLSASGLAFGYVAEGSPLGAQFGTGGMSAYADTYVLNVDGAAINQTDTATGAAITLQPNYGILFWHDAEGYTIAPHSQAADLDPGTHNFLLPAVGGTLATVEKSVQKPTTPVANANTSGATLAQLETEVNELKALLRTAGLIAP